MPNLRILSRVINERTRIMASMPLRPSTFFDSLWNRPHSLFPAVFAPFPGLPSPR
jgi:hypothetical protein